MTRPAKIEKKGCPCCARIAQIIEDVDDRCMADDGPVSTTREGITNREIVTIYRLAKNGRISLAARGEGRRKK